NIFVTHAHLDHSLGIPFYAGQRHLQRIAGGRVFVPSEAAGDFRTLMALHEKLEDTGYDIEIVGVGEGEVVSIGKGHEVRGDRAARYRHIHFDDIAEFAERFENKMIVLTHFSRRYSRAEIRDEIRRRCPPLLRERIRLALPEPFQRL